MLHIRKSLTFEEQVAHYEQQERQRLEHQAFLRKHGMTEAGLQAEKDASFWQKQAQARSANTRGLIPVQRPSVIPEKSALELKNISAEVVFMDKNDGEAKMLREALAAEETKAKQLRTAPVYNKGGSMYWSDGMLADMKTGQHKRRN